MSKKSAPSPLVDQTDLVRILQADHADPFGVLGMHPLPHGRGLVVRAFLPHLRSAVVVSRGGEPARYAAARLHEDGFYVAHLPDRQELFAYELEVEDHEGHSWRMRDPYSFWPRMGGYDQYLFNEGTHFQVHRHLGAHRAQVDGTWGVQFAVWAPNARRASVVGDFNRWDGRVHSMRSLGASGIWEIFVPHLEAGAVYKYELRTAAGDVLLKADPCGFRMEVPPRSGSVVHDLGGFVWSDAEWLAARPQRNWLTEPVAIYEVHAGSWRTVLEEGGRPLTYRELAHQLVPYVRDLGFTHVELMPVAEFPFAGSWGYQVTGYFAPTSRYGLPEDFAYFVDYCHAHGIGVIVDWVPAHFPRDGHGLAGFDGTCLYEHRDPRQGAHPDWGTLVFNFGRNEVRSFLLSNALFWFEQYHVDGIRVDAVASMLYLDYSRPAGEWLANPHGGRENLEAIHFVKQLNTEVYARHPGVLTIAEESTAWPAVSRPTYAGGLGFGFKWNMGWMNDVLRYMSKDPVHRKYYHSDLTFGMLYLYHENFILPLSHDEVVHGKGSLLDKMPGDGWRKFANLRLLFGFMYGHPGKKLLFMGGEFGQGREWSHLQSLDWHLLEYEPHRGVQQWVRDLNRLYRRHPGLYRTDALPGGFAWVDCQDVENSVVAFVRQDPESGQWLLFVGNFTPVPRPGYRVGVPQDGFYREVLNSDAALYGGSNAGNQGGVAADPRPWHGFSWSVELHLPPLAMLVLEPATREG